MAHQGQALSGAGARAFGVAKSRRKTRTRVTALSSPVSPWPPKAELVLQFVAPLERHRGRRGDDDQVDAPAQPDYDEDEITEAAEGRVFTRLHRYRERNRALVERRKQGSMRAAGKLACEACGFDFRETYGSRGEGYIEAHHTKPVHTLAEDGGTTKLEDLALVCANCHRMIHAARPWLTVAELKALLSD